MITLKSVKQEFVDDVLNVDGAPENQRQSAQAVKNLIEADCLTVRSPNFELTGDVVDEASRRIVDESQPEHAGKAHLYHSAPVCELAEDERTHLKEGDSL